MKELHGLSPVVDLATPRSTDMNTESRGFRMGSALGLLVRFGFPKPYDDSYLQTQIRRNKCELLSDIPVQDQEPMLSKFILRREVIERSERGNIRHQQYLGALATIMITGEHNALQHQGLLTGFGYTMWSVDNAEMEAVASPDDIALIGDLLAPDEASIEAELQAILHGGSAES